MLYFLYTTIGILLIGIVFLIKANKDKTNATLDISRQFNELRGQYQNIEYKLQMSEKTIRDLNAKNKLISDELETLLDNPMVNATKIRNRIK